MGLFLEYDHPASEHRNQGAEFSNAARRRCSAGIWWRASLRWFCWRGPVAADALDPVLARVQAVEARLQARVGLMVVDTGTGRRWAYHADARFPMASTVKALICAAALARGEDLMARRVPIRTADLVPHAPVMAGQVGEDVSLAERDAGIADIGQALAATLSGSWLPGASE